MKKSLNYRLLAFICTFSFLMLTGAVTEALPIDPNISITGSVTLDTTNSYALNQAGISGTMSTTIGGSSTSTTYSHSGSGTLSVIGLNPLNGTLTDTGDGFGVTGAAFAIGDENNDGEFAIGADILMTLINSSAADTYQVTVATTFNNEVDSGGFDAYVDSEFTLDSRLSTTPAPGTEEFFLHLVTDTINGNEVGGNPAAGLGGPLSDSGTDTLVLTLNPGDTYILDGDWTMEGGAFPGDPGDSVAILEDFSAQLTITDVVNITRPIPEPSTLLLLVTGLLGVVGLSRKLKRA